jgi:hypothetical protein
MIANLDDLRPGDLMFGPISGWAGTLVNAGQAILRESTRLGTLVVEHVGVIVRASTVIDGMYWPPAVGQAMPGGAAEYDMDDAGYWSPRYAYVRLPEDYPGQARDAARVMDLMCQEQIPYSPLSYLALSAWRLGLGAERLEAWINRRRPAEVVTMPSGRELELALPCEGICSVLADQAWSLTGKKIMTGVPHQCVTPGALAARVLELPGIQLGLPGRLPLEGRGPRLL